MRKPQVEQLWNDITLTLVSPEGVIMYHLISIMFFLMTRIEPRRWCYFTQNGSVIVWHIWTTTAHSDVNFMSPSSNSKGETPVSRQYVLLPKPFCVKPRLYWPAWKTETEDSQQKMWNTHCERARARDRFVTCLSDLWTFFFLQTTLTTKEKFTLASHSHRATRWCPCVATSNTLLLLHDSVSQDCSWASSSPWGPIK